MSLYREVKSSLAQIQKENPPFSLDSTDKIILAISGGPDSLALLHLFSKRGLHPAQNIVVAHLDHQLRSASTAESQQVSHITAEWGAVIRTKQANVAAMAQQEGLSIEEAGRKARYQFFAELAAEYDANYIFTGHHAGDQAETVLMHFLRGSGLAGLRGMLPFSPLADYPGRWLVRPLLNTSREQIEAYCERHQLQPLIDESNNDTAFFRNRLRHDLLPILEKYNPKIRERLLAMAAVTAADFDWLQAQTAEAWATIHQESGRGWLRFDLAGWQTLPLSLRRSALRLAVGQLRPNLRDVSFQTIEQARQVAEKGAVGAEATLPDDMRLSIGYDYILISLPGIDSPLPKLPQMLSDEPVVLPVPGFLSLANGWTLQAQWLAGTELEQIEQNDNPWIAYMDVPKGETLIVRPRLAGERFQPLGMNGRTKSVKTVMIDRKIPAELRPRWPIIAAAHLLWVAGYALDERVKVGEDSERILKLLLEQLKPSS